MEIARRELIFPLNLRNDKFLPSCEVCLEDKLTALPFSESTRKSSKLLGIVQTDVCGPMKTESIRKAKYFVTFINDFSRCTKIRFLRNKNKVCKVFKAFKTLVEIQIGLKVKCLQLDNGSEFYNNDFHQYLKEDELA